MSGKPENEFEGGGNYSDKYGKHIMSKTNLIVHENAFFMYFSLNFWRVKFGNKNNSELIFVSHSV